MSKSTIKNLLVCIACLFYLSACAESSSGSDSGDGVIRSDSDNNGNNVLEGKAIDIGDEWLYRKGTSAPPSDWISVGFDDATWLAGNSGIGYGDGDDATILSDMSGNYVTVYTRKVINYDGSFNINSLALDIDYDDGFVAYINGQEVARANMPAGQPSFDTLANISYEAGTAESFNLDGFISLINIGDNVLAIEIHNSRLASSDLSFLPSLLVNMEGLPPSPTVSLSANPTSVVTNGSTTLNWSSTDATSCTASGDWSGSKATSGSQTISALITNSNFTLTCSGAGGTANDSISVTVSDPSAPIVNLSASPSSVAYNGSTTLTWSSSNTTGCTATGDWAGSMATSGSQTISALITNSSFTLTCNGAGGTANDSVSVTVAAPSAPTVNLSASPTSVSSNGSTTLTWTGSNVDSCTASGDWSGSMATSGSQMINGITTNSSFELSCSGINGSANDSVSVTVAGPANIAQCSPLPAPSGNIITANASQASSLGSLVSSLSTGDTLLLEDGIYDLNGAALGFNTPGVTLRSASGNPDNVILDGNYISTQIITIRASNVTVAGITITRAFTHPIQITSSNLGDTDNTLIYRVNVVDAREQAIKINPHQSGFYTDNGTIACSSIKLTDQGRPNVNPVITGCYTGGIDAHQARGWTVRDNTIEGFWCSSGLSEHAIHFWRGSRDTIVERNILKNNARGIGLGLSNSGTARTYNDNFCPQANNAYIGHYGGIVRNNSIHVSSADLLNSPSGFDCGVCLASACKATIVHNSIVSTGSNFSSIEWRFDGSTGVEIHNNIATHSLRERNGASANLSGNLENANLSLFVDGQNGDLHLAPGAASAIDMGVQLNPGLSDFDIDGDSRDAFPDIGVDEFVN